MAQITTEKEESSCPCRRRTSRDRAPATPAATETAREDDTFPHQQLIFQVDLLQAAEHGYFMPTCQALYASDTSV
jgi:hypothetical protein